MTGIVHFTIATEAEKSADFRRVLWTGEYSQLVIMTIPVGGEIGAETHPDTDQILTIVSGIGEATISGQTKKIAQGDLVVVPAGLHHNFVNTGVNPLVLYTVYGPPEHAEGAIHKTREEADALEDAGKDEPPA
ncbi:cupin domain-containing protein [Marisediminicola senii]|uniref:cupin domain-containing protein n=1 Tax=Marisediminicola senii TaxID=2711233 RepID=UPI0019115A70|nr:cupin domain-containing protein [Marisediminicola senii]